MTGSSAKSRNVEDRVIGLAASKEHRVVFLGSQTVSTTTPTQVTNMSAPVASGIIYNYEVHMVGLAAISGIYPCGIQMTGPAVSGNSWETHYFCNGNGATGQQAETNSTFGYSEAVGSFSTTYESHINIHGAVQFSASGTLAFKIYEGISGDPITVNGCIMVIRPIQ